MDLTLTGRGKSGARALLGGAVRVAAGSEKVSLFGKQQLRYVRIWRVLEHIHQNLVEGRTITQVRLLSTAKTAAESGRGDFADSSLGTIIAA